MNKNLDLFLTFAKIGFTTFGGGYAMISIIQDEVVEKKKWISDDDLLKISAIAESTPGPIAINLATYVGYKKGKFIGSLLATLGVTLPSLLILFVISLFFQKFIGNTYVHAAFVGIKCAVCFLILKAAIEMFIKTKKNLFNIFICILVTTLMILFEIFHINFSSIYFILIGGILGLIYYTIMAKITFRKEERK